MIMNLVRAAAILTVAAMVGFIVMARRRDDAAAHP
jgi:NADH:ubiquinone oxidoreductase subunit 6 (subunit J)